MDDSTMFELFDSLKREMHQELAPVKLSLERIEARLDRKGERIEDANRGLRYGRIPQ